MPERAGYHFGPRESPGSLAGWRAGQVAWVASGLGLAVACLRVLPVLPGSVAGLAVLALGVLGATLQLGGRTAEEWAPVALRWLAGGLGARRYVSRLVEAGEELTVPSGGRGGASRGAQVSLPPPFRGCRLLCPPAAPSAPRLGVVHDAAARSYVAVLRVQSRPAALAGSEERRRRVAAWAGLLASLAAQGQPVHRLQWVERCVPAGLARFRGAAPTAGVPVGSLASYARLLDDEEPTCWRHEVLVALAVRARRSPRSGGASGEAAHTDLLGSRVRDLQAELERAGLASDGPLAAPALSSCIRQAFLGDAALRDPAAEEPAGDPWPWPLATETTWSAYRTESTWHATYWIAQWPRLEVGPDFLAPLLLGPPARRTVALTLQPVTPARAAREAEQARTADLADAELRRRSGFAPSARRSRQAESVARREGELADGHAQLRFSGYVGITASSPEELERACRAVEQSAALARIELCRLYGEADAAFTFTLPLARGLS
ncbi:MAG: SCO6880 family protein [Acidimicrobiales bacterium]